MANRSKRSQNNESSSLKSKRRKLDSNVDATSRSEILARHENKLAVSGTVLTLGVGDTGQLGLGPDTLERTKPTRFSAASLKSAGLDELMSEKFIQVAAGGMHNICLTSSGCVYSFGCNDEGALGRASTSISPEENDEDKELVIEETRPGIVLFPEVVKIKMVSAGDSHSAALDSDGRVWLWGTFRGSGGVLGLTKVDEIYKTPVMLTSIDASVVKIASGQDHLVCLTEHGRLLTMGCAEQGQLGRIAERFAKDGGRNGLDSFLQPGECRLKGGKRFCDVWAGGFATIAREMSSGKIYACGLNNYGQLALVSHKNDDEFLAPLTTSPSEKQKTTNHLNSETAAVNESEQLSESMLMKKQGPLVQFMLIPALGFDAEKNWRQFALGMHHTLALTEAGKVYSVGRSDYGRLGCRIVSDTDSSAVAQPQLVKGALEGQKCCWVGCGEACSFAVDDKGVAYAWGMGSNQQLSQAEEDVDVCEPSVMLGKNLETRRVLMIDAGGQHTIMLANDPSRPTLPVVEILVVEPKHSKPAGEEPMDTSVEVVPLMPKVNGAEAMEMTVVPRAEGKHVNEEMSIVEKKAKLSEDVSVAQLPPPSQPLMADREAVSAPSDVVPEISATSPSECTPSMTEASTAGATVNSSSVRSFSMASGSQSQAVSDGGSSCSNASTESVVSSAQSIDGGGSSRLSSLGGTSVQSSLFAHPINDDSLAGDLRADDGRRRGLPFFPLWGSVNASVGGGMSICSTSSEPGFPTDTTSLGSMTASPLDVVGGGGDTSNPTSGYPLT